jgi:hypothetical protein
MQGDRFANAQQAAAAAIDQILDGTWFAIIAGTDQANRAFPYPNAVSPMVRMEPGAREEAKRAIRHLLAGGGTAMGTWLRLATQLFSSVPNVTQRHAILLTDGKNQSESSRSLQDAVRAAQGVFQCDCRGVGADWDVRSSAASPPPCSARSTSYRPRHSSRRPSRDHAERHEPGRRTGGAAGVGAAGRSRALRPQVAPQVEDLTGRRQDVNPLTGAYPTGAWGDESRDYHVACGSRPNRSEPSSWRPGADHGRRAGLAQGSSRRSGPTTTA